VNPVWRRLGGPARAALARALAEMRILKDLPTGVIVGRAKISVGPSIADGRRVLNSQLHGRVSAIARHLCNSMQFNFS
jgi:hypothetical protein